MESSSTNFWATLIGALLGLVIGIFVQYGVEYLKRKDTRKDQKLALIKEMQFNLSLLKEILSLYSELRDFMNAGNFSRFEKYIPINKAMSSQTFSLLSSGVIYEWMEIDDIKKLQYILTFFTPFNEKWVNDNINERKLRIFKSEIKQNDHSILEFVNFIENQAKVAQENISTIVAGLVELKT